MLGCGAVCLILIWLAFMCVCGLGARLFVCIDAFVCIRKCVCFVCLFVRSFVQRTLFVLLVVFVPETYIGKSMVLCQCPFCACVLQVVVP